MHSTENIQYTIRPFLTEEMSSYKNMRLEALQLEPGMFGNSYAREAAFSADQWLARLNNENSACFGLYRNEELIGITGIVVDWNDDTIGLMTQSYIRKQYRGKGLSNLFYRARIEWAKNRSLKTLRIGHKESNLISKAANQRYQFKYVYRESETWPDGSTEDILYYDLELS